MCTYHPFCMFQQFYFPQKLPDALGLWVLQTLRYPVIPASCNLPLKRPERLILLLLLLLLIFVSMEWSNKNCGAISEVCRYLSSVWFPNNYILSGSHCALRTKSVPQSDFLSLEDTIKRASGLEFLFSANGYSSESLAWWCAVLCLHLKYRTPLSKWRF